MSRKSNDEPPPMATLELALLGVFQAHVAGQAIDVPGRKERALLAVLAMTPGEARSRDKLAGLLWGDRADKQARDSLKQALLRLRKSFDSEHPLPLLADREILTLDRNAVMVDVAEFERLIEEGTPAATARAISLYRGELLEGLDIGESGFDEWLLIERQRLRDMARDALARLLDQHVASGAHDQAGAIARRLLALDPLREAAHRALMQIYAAQGQTALALKQYQLCRDALQHELGIRPEAETDRLYRSIQDKRTDARRTHSQAPANEAPVETSPRPRSAQSMQDLEADRSATPSIAVLPFTNLSGDPEQEYFADGIAEDIISGLTRLPWLFVIARDSSFTYKGKTVDVKQVGRELGVRYLLEGSVRKAGERIRIASQLIDAATSAHLWTDRFEGSLSDIFDVQDQITASVIGAIEPKLRSAEIQRARRKPTENVDAYDLFLRAVAFNATRKKEDNKEALRLLYRAIEIDHHYATAYALAGYCYLRQYTQRWVLSTSDPAMAEGIRMARLAAEYGQDDPEALWMASVTIAFVAGDLESSAALIERSLALNPNSANGLMASGLVRALLGDTDTAIAHLERSKQLSPLDPIAYGTSLGFAWAHFMAGRYEEASAWCDRALHEAPTYFPPALNMKIACCGQLGRLEEGHNWVQRLLAVDPDASLSSLRTVYQLFLKKPDRLEALLEGLRRAGLPNGSMPNSAKPHLSPKPSIAVLPFTNLSADPEQQYLSDGITEDIITELSRYRSLLVIDRNSCFRFRDQAAAEVGRQLGARYIVEGSIRRAGNRLHLTARLIDAVSGSHLWAERYDRSVDSIFALQDELTRTIAGTLEGRVAASGADQAKRRPTPDWAAYDHFLQGREQVHRYNFIEAEPYLLRAVELDPGYAQAHALLAKSALSRHWHDPLSGAKDTALEHAQRALSIDDADAWCQMTMGFVLTHCGQRDLAGPYFERAVSLNPTDVQIAYLRAWWLARMCRGEEALQAMDSARLRDPFPPEWFWELRAIALLVARRYEEVIEALRQMSYPRVWDHAYVAACHAYLNRPAEARAAAAEVLKLDPRFTVSRYALVEDYIAPAELKHLLDGMRRAGLPE
jgi:TolB-like protein/DNA-binding SARP family transcriptional activator/Tfp pilus assembly protein PilF